MRLKELANILEEFSPKGVLKGQELVLTTQENIDLLEKVSLLGVCVLGFDGWYYKNQLLVQNLDIDFAVDDSLLQNSNSVLECAKVVKSALTDLAPDTLTSLTLFIPPKFPLFE